MTAIDPNAANELRIHELPKMDELLYDPFCHEKF